MKYNPIPIILFFVYINLIVPVSASSLSDYNYDTCWLSLIQINGSTNVNQFSFTYPSAKKAATTNLVKVNINNSYDFFIPVKDFQSSNAAMTKDFLKMMQANQYPRVVVTFDSKAFNNISIKTPTNLNLYLTLAGVRKSIKAKCSANFMDDNRILIHGTTEIKLSDFSLSPPEKAFGLIKVKDAVNVNFDLIIKTTPNKQVAKS